MKLFQVNTLGMQMRFEPRSAGLETMQIILRPLWEEDVNFSLVYSNPAFLGMRCTSKRKHLCVVLVSSTDMLENLS